MCSSFLLLFRDQPAVKNPSSSSLPQMHHSPTLPDLCFVRRLVRESQATTCACTTPTKLGECALEGTSRTSVTSTSCRPPPSGKACLLLFVRWGWVMLVRPVLWMCFCIGHGRFVVLCLSTFGRRTLIASLHGGGTSPAA